MIQFAVGDLQPFGQSPFAKLLQQPAVSPRRFESFLLQAQLPDTDGMLLLQSRFVAAELGLKAGQRSQILASEGLP